MSSPRLTETSYIVLGLLETTGEDGGTPYDIKRAAQISVFNFWSVPHTQIYTECDRLAKAGLLTEQREDGGRRRRFYRLTDEGRSALDAWRAEPTEELYELRDLGILKLFFGSDPAQLAQAQLRAHERKLVEMEGAVTMPWMPEGMRLSIEAGINAERAAIRFWKRLATADA